MRPRALRDIGADLTADPVDRVARLAALGREDARAGYRVLARAEHGLGPCSVERDQRECDSDGPNHGSDHGRPFLSGLGDRRERFHPTGADATRIIPKSQQLLELQLQYPCEYACRTWALSKTATPKACSSPGSRPFQRTGGANAERYP